jgi:small ligand-binding sensory domain FIST
MTSAFEQAGGALEKQFGGAAPDLLIAFLSADHAPEAGRLAALARRRFPSALLVGCTGLGVIGAAREAEDGPALSLTGASLPGVERTGFHLDLATLPAPDDVTGWRDQVGQTSAARPGGLLLLADPFTMDATALIAGLDRAFPGAPKFGGLASGGRRPGEHPLLLGGAVHREGAVGVAFSGALAVDTLVAQGCRAIGEPMRVTRCRGNQLQALDERPPLDVLTELHEALDPRDQELMQHSLFLGLEVHGRGLEHRGGELLVRNLVGVDHASGAIAVGAELHQHQRVQFMLRDARTAEEDLQRLLDCERHDRAAGRPSGALLFSCTGRGAGLFGCADHDTGLFVERLGPVPLGGFFCNGEIGPVAGTTYLHGYTSAFALFREAGRDRGAPPGRAD